MARVDNYTDIGGEFDRVAFVIDGKKLRHYTKYSLNRGILNQPATFSVTLGSGDLAREILSQFNPGSEMWLQIGPTKVFSGVLEDPIAGGGTGATEVTFQGRDWLAPLTRTDVIDERSFGSPTYFELTKKVMELAGYENTNLIAGNDSNRRSVSRVAAYAKPAKQVVESISTGMGGNQGAKIQYNTIKCELGQSWFDFLVSQYKKVGLYLWCSGEGDLVLAKPTAEMPAIYKIERFRGIPRTMGSVLSATLTNRTSSRHAYCRCYGKGHADKNGRRAIHGSWNDFEMLQLGYTNTRVLYDNDCTTWREAEYIAKRTLAEERRQHRTLTYTLAGHTVPSLANPSLMAIWTPDTMVRVDDDELAFPGEEGNGIHEELYVESVEMSRGPATTTTVSLMRKGDLLYLGEDTDNEGKNAPIQAAKVKRKRRK